MGAIIFVPELPPPRGDTQLITATKTTNANTANQKNLFLTMKPPRRRNAPKYAKKSIIYNFSLVKDFNAYFVQVA